MNVSDDPDTISETMNIEDPESQHVAEVACYFYGTQVSYQVALLCTKAD